MLKSPQYLNILMTVSFLKVLFSFFSTSPMSSIALAMKVSSVRPVGSISSHLVKLSSADAYLSSTTESKNVMESFNLSISILTDFVVPLTYRVISFSPASASTILLRFLRMAIFFSKRFTVIEYWITSMLVSRVSSLASIKSIIFLVLTISSA